MQCAACGTFFEGNFCPQCGTPAAPPAAVASRAAVCYRCGTGYYGNFCPACGAPAPAPLPGPAYVPVAMPPPSTAKAVLSYVWVLALALFFVLLASNFATLSVVTPQIVDGIQQVRSGATVNAGHDAGATNWSFQAVSGRANGSWSAFGGNPGGFLQTELSGTSLEVVSGYWTQPLVTSGSSPYVAVVRFDYRPVQPSAPSVAIWVFVDRDPGPPNPNTYVFRIQSINPAGGWTSAMQPDPATGELSSRIDVTSAVRDSGTYYLKVLIEATYSQSTAGTTIVGLDNLQLRWGTNAGLVLFLIVPFPITVARSRDPLPFTAYYALIALALAASLVYQLAVDARPLWRAMTSPPEDLGGRLRARVGLIALVQTFLAVYSFQVIVILILNALQVPTPSPFSPEEFPPWFLLYEFANASVYEELITRVMMIGLPLFAASLVMRTRLVVARSATVGPRRGRFLLGSLRYLYGGNVTRYSPMPTLIAGGALLAISSAVFGLAHAPGFGDWKIVPAAVAGLGLGYLYLRHGLAAAILFHFANNYFGAILFTPNPGGWGVFLELLFWGVVAFGAAFFAYYVWYAGKLVGHVVARPRGPAAARVVPTAAPPPGWMPGPAVAPQYPAAPAPAAPPWGTPRPPPVSIPPNYSPPGRPPPYGVAPVQFRCARCGWIEARYDQGHFTCLRCGATT